MINHKNSPFHKKATDALSIAFHKYLVNDQQAESMIPRDLCHSQHHGIHGGSCSLEF